METRLAIGNEETNDRERKEEEARNYEAASINSKGKQTEQSKLRDEMTRGSKQEMIDDERNFGASIQPHAREIMRCSLV